uniref:G_PROTEIN_RECEP_F1_2 domain-containing protein n=1 Tax=Steinernema glaseri TaxID=37863 RepID=A0A1I7YKJ5_9BILA
MVAESKLLLLSAQTIIALLTILFGIILLLMLLKHTPAPMRSYGNYLLNIVCWSLSYVFVIIIAQPTTFIYPDGFCWEANLLGALLPQVVARILMILIVVLTVQVGVAICLSFIHRYLQVKGCLRVQGVSETSASYLSGFGVALHLILSGFLYYVTHEALEEYPNLSSAFCLNVRFSFYNVFMITIIVISVVVSLCCIFLCFRSMQALVLAKKSSPATFAFERMLTVGIIVSSALPITLGALPSAITFGILKVNPVLVQGLVPYASFIASLTSFQIFVLSLVTLKPYREKVRMFLGLGKHANITVSVVTKL